MVVLGGISDDESTSLDIWVAYLTFRCRTVPVPVLRSAAAENAEALQIAEGMESSPVQSNRVEAVLYYEKVGTISSF